MQNLFLQKQISADSEKNLKHFQRKLGRISTLLTKEVNKVGTVALPCNVYHPLTKTMQLGVEECRTKPKLPPFV